MIKAVLFDLDDTLYRELDFVEQGFYNVAAVIAENITERKPDSGAPGTEDLLHRMLELLKKEGRGAIFNRICERYHADISVQELVRIYRETKPVLSLYADAEELLAWLEKRGIKTGLITDGNGQVQHAKIQALRLDKRMDAVLVSSDLGLTKPDREVYEYCIRKIGCNPEETVYIGDNPLKDFIGAREIGMKTVRIIRPEGMYMKETAETGYEADVTVKLLTELEKRV